MTKNKLQNELFSSGLIEAGNSAKINAFKRAYRADYNRIQNKEYKKKTHRKRLTFTDEENEYLNSLARTYDNMPLATLLKASIFAYHNGTYIHTDKEKLTKIEYSLRDMNRRIAESIQYIHLSREIRTSDIEAIKLDISELEKSISTTLKTPPRLEQWLDQMVVQDELFIPKLLRAVAEHLTL